MKKNFVKACEKGLSTMKRNYVYEETNTVHFWEQGGLLKQIWK